jgi:hypothetical protein
MNKKTMGALSEHFAPGKLKIEPKLLNKQSHLKPVKNIIKKGLFFASVAGLLFTGAELGREFVEEVTSDNKIVTVGPFVLKNKETRSIEKLYADVENAFLQIDGIEQIFAPEVMEKTKKQELVNTIIQTLTQAGNIPETSVVEVEWFPNDSAFNGSVYLNNTTFTTKNIMVESIDNTDLPNLVETILEEVLHRIAFQNDALSQNLTQFDKRLIKILNALDANTYESSFIETNPKMLASKIMLNLKNQVAPNANYHTNGRYLVINDMINNLYNSTEDINGILPNMLPGTGKLQDRTYYVNDARKFDVNNYKTKTLEEIFLLSYMDKLKKQNINYENIDLTNTYYYKLGMVALSDVKNITFQNFLKTSSDFTLSNKNNTQNTSSGSITTNETLAITLDEEELEF